MICDSCSWEADEVKAGRTTHAQLKRVEREWLAWGATRSPIGHSACKGGTQCCCQHKDVGSVVIR